VARDHIDCELARQLADPYVWVRPRPRLLAEGSEDSMTTVAPATPGTRTTPSHVPLLLAALAGGAVALSLGVYGNVHEPTGEKIFTLGFPSVIEMKAWLATGAFALVGVQILTALRMFGRIKFPREMQGWIPLVHRWSGTAAFLLTLPVAYHCLWSLGFQSNETRVLAHSLFGCAFYGAFTTKLLSLRIAQLPKWALPVIGGLLVTTLTGLWLTASLWYFRTQ
jgi:hypothetical protein